MKLIKQQKLYFVEGKSDKVYEVDLCESQDLFLVNFRYGRRGANLREGTKTVFPVALQEAEDIFEKLIESKKNKGYTEQSDGIDTSANTTNSEPENSVRTATILQYLKEGASNSYSRDWKMSRIILRVGVLKIKEAIPLLVPFLKSSDQFEKYNSITVLASFENDNYKEEIFYIFEKEKFNTISGRAAAAYLIKFGTILQKKAIKSESKDLVSVNKLENLSTNYLNQDQVDPMLLYSSYIFSFDDEILRDEVFTITEKISIRVNTFKSIRYIYRAAQLTNDIRFLALLSKRIAISKPGYLSEYIYANDDWVLASEEKQKKNPAVAFSAKTKNYFNKVAYKKTYELSKSDVDAYIQLATQILSSLNDNEDQEEEITQVLCEYNTVSQRYENEHRYYPKYANYLALLYILYGNSTRFQHQKVNWYCTMPITDQVESEEILPEVWDQKKTEVLSILAHSKSRIATEFALRIIKRNPNFLNQLSDDVIAQLINHYDNEVVVLIIAYLKNKYSNSKPSTTVVLALLSSPNDEAVQLGLDWLSHYKTDYFRSKSWVNALLLTNQIAVLDFLKTEYVSTPSSIYAQDIDFEALQPLFVFPNSFSHEYLIGLSNLIGTSSVFGKLFSDVTADQISQLSNTPQVTNLLFAINLAKHNKQPAFELFKDSFNNYIQSEEPLVRKAGIELIAYFPDDFLIAQQQVIISYCFSEYSEIREAISSTIQRLIALVPKFKNQLLNQLLQTITTAEVVEGIHQSSHDLLVKYYQRDLELLSSDQIIEFVLSPYEFAQNMGTPLFKKKINLHDLTITQLVSLGTSPVFSVRNDLQDYFYSQTKRINTELEQALTLFNSDWQDVIDWSLDYFEEKIEAKNWSLDLLLYVCDHIKPAVQQLGTKMLTKHFSDAKGLPMLMKLQEHPTAQIRHFVSNLLHAHAQDNPLTILGLEQYFKTTLFAIQSNRIAKNRVYSFLEQEAQKSKDVAQMTVDVITSVLDTKIRTDREKNISLLLAIAQAYPDIEVPLLITDLENEV